MVAKSPAQKVDVGQLILEAAGFHRTGDLGSAEQIYRRVLKLQPKNPDALHLLGLVLNQRGDVAAGIDMIRKALAVRDDFPEAHQNIAVIFGSRGALDDAERHYRTALRYRPSSLPAYIGLAAVLRHKGRFAEAVEIYGHTLQREPRSVDALVELARTFRIANDLPAMAAAVQNALAVAPEHSLLHIMSAEACFGSGRLAEGWQEYRWRFRSAENCVAAKSYALPEWAGEDLSNRTILVWGEQGVGDEIMYANMIPDVIARVGHCAIQCSPRLATLFKRSFPTATVYTNDLTAAELQDIAVQSPAGSLGAYLRDDFARFPPDERYLRADPVRRAELRARYQAGKSDTLLVGIAWRSSAGENAPDKSVSILNWGPILNVPGVTFVNLQYGDCTAELDAVAKGFGKTIVHDRSINPLGDMDDYAAQVAAMDLVISSSNTAAHMAGALGVPTLCMLPFSLGRGRRWYWFAEQGRCPWYPAMRLFVQKRDGEWLDVLRDVGLALVDAVAARGQTVTPYLRAMAQAFTGMQRWGDAEALYLRLAEEPGCAAELFLLIAQGRKAALDAEGVFEFCDRAIASDPGLWQAYNEKGVVFSALNRFDEAVSVYARGLEQNPNSVELHNNIGTALRKLGRAQEARTHYERALALAPLDFYSRDSIELNLAGILSDGGDTAASLETFGRLLARTPDNVDARYSRAQTLLSVGRFTEGWHELEWRLRTPTANVRYDSFPGIKRWRGEDIGGKRVLIWTEQGIGDEILISTMIPDAMAVAKHVTVLCSERLVPVFRRSFPTATVDERKEPLPKSAIDPRLDFQMSMSDLGLAFRKSFENFPALPKGLASDESRKNALRAKYLARHPGRPLVGLSWSSQKNHEIGWLKSSNVAAWGPILTVPGITFVCLQYGDHARELAEIRDRYGVEILDDSDIDSLKDMDGFAAQVAAMDLVISTSNTTVHTAGALQVPTWVLVAQGRGRHWYWFRDKQRSPWYPSVRLFSQNKAGGWDDAIHRIAADLLDWTRQQEKSGTA